MKNKVFNIWIKELCSLVFVQSLQALLLTIAFSVIMRLWVGSKTSYAANQSMGVYAIIILWQLPKIELLVKKIFGLGSGVMDDSMMGGKRSLLKTGMALSLGGRVLNNAGKVVGGVGGLVSNNLIGRRKINIAEKNKQAALNESNNSSSGKNQKVGNKNARKGISSGSSSGKSGSYSLGDLTSAIKSANAKKPEDEIDEIKENMRKQNRESLKKMTSGVAETIGAVGGASLGAMVALGTGSDDLIQDTVMAAGVGDIVGEKLTDGAFNTIGGISDFAHQYKALGKKLNEKNDKNTKTEKVKADYDKAIQAAAKRRVTGAKSSGVRTNYSSKGTPVKDTVALNYMKGAVKARNSGDMEKYNDLKGKAVNTLKQGNVNNAQTKTSSPSTKTPKVITQENNANTVNKSALSHGTDHKRTTPSTSSSSNISFNKPQNVTTNNAKPVNSESINGAANRNSGISNNSSNNNNSNNNSINDI